jgi:hypothetical protein
MPNSEFSLSAIVERFGLTTVQENGLFALIPPVPAISTALTTILADHVPLAVAINTEKARSELIVINVLTEVRRQMEGRISVFSGVELDVDRTNSLSGYCDFLISLSPEQLLVRAPIVALVEAKNADLPAAWGQCCPEMIAAQRFNEQRGNPLPKVYGAVTSGTAWMFGTLEGITLTVDLQEYIIDEPERIVGILIAMVQQIV